MSKDDELQLQRGAATNTEGEQGNEGGKYRDHGCNGYSGGAKISRLSQRFEF
jgi:hypothetical protein